MSSDVTWRSASDRIRAIVAAVLDTDVAEIGPGASFYEDLASSSLEKVEIVARVEREFGVSIDGEAAAAARCVDDLLAVVEPPTSRRIDLVATLVGGHVERGSGDRVSYVDGERGAVTYAALRTAAARYEARLGELGVAPGSRCVVIGDDAVDTVAVILGLWWHGVVPVTVSPALTSPELAYIIRDCGASTVHRDAMAVAREDLHEVVAGLATTGPADLDALFGDTGVPAVAAPATWAAGQEALVQYTSGSTSGAPKGVRHSTAGVEAVLAGFGQVLRLAQDDVVLSTAKLSFGYGFGNSVLLSLSAGATAVLLAGAVDPHAVISAVRGHRPTVLFSVPRVYAALLAAGADLSGVRLAVTAGEHCPARLAARVRDELGVPLVNGLGATEVLHVVIASHPDSVPGALGKPVPGVTATVRGSNGEQVEPGREGRLHISGDTVAMGYLRPADEDGVFAHGGVYTNDFVRVGDDGDFAHLCRTDDMLNLGGYKVAPSEIEAVVRATPGVADCAVVGFEDEDGLEHAVVYAVAAEPGDSTALRRKIVASARAGLASFKRPTRVEVVEALPTTSTGKLARYRLRALAGQR